MQIAILLQARRLAAQPRAHRLQRRAGANWRVKSHACAATRSSIPVTAKAFWAIGAKRRAPCAAIETWSSWLADVGIESTLAG